MCLDLTTRKKVLWHGVEYLVSNKEHCSIGDASPSDEKCQRGISTHTLHKRIEDLQLIIPQVNT